MNLILWLAFFADPPKPPVIPDGVKAQFSVASKQLESANKVLDDMMKADPKLRKAIEDVVNGQQVMTKAADNAFRACPGFTVKVEKGVPECVKKP